MRDNKYRGKCKKNNEWIYGLVGYCNFNHGVERAIIQKTNLGSIIPERTVDNTISQFIGLQDENGVDIYEGDIVRFNNQVGKVVFEKGTFGISFTNRIDWVRLDGEYLAESFSDTLCACYNDHYISFFEIFCICDGYDEVEVIGNIYDNPELLKVG